MTEDHWEKPRQAYAEIRAFVDPANPDSTIDPALRGRLLGFTEYGPVYSGLGGITLNPADLMLEAIYDDGFPWALSEQPATTAEQYAEATKDAVARLRADGYDGPITWNGGPGAEA